PRALPSFPTRRSSDLPRDPNYTYAPYGTDSFTNTPGAFFTGFVPASPNPLGSFNTSTTGPQPESAQAQGLTPGLLYYWRLVATRSEEHTSELQSPDHL